MQFVLVGLIKSVLNPTERTIFLRLSGWLYICAEWRNRQMLLHIRNQIESLTHVLLFTYARSFLHI